MTYIKDLIHIPDQVGRGDFVLRLSEGITDLNPLFPLPPVYPKRCFNGCPPKANS